MHTKPYNVDTSATRDELQVRALGDRFIYRRGLRWRVFSLLGLFGCAAGYQVYIW